MCVSISFLSIETRIFTLNLITNQVIYGDTDSVMINTNVDEVTAALQIGNEFKKAVNERYRLLEIDIDAVFQRMLLLQKKKYAAVEMKPSGETSIEIKGLDMKRREYCALSKNVSGWVLFADVRHYENIRLNVLPNRYVLKQILSGEATEVVVEKIHEYLTTVGEGVRGGKVPLDDFIVLKVNIVPPHTPNLCPMANAYICTETWQKPSRLSRREKSASRTGCTQAEGQRTRPESRRRYTLHLLPWRRWTNRS